MDVDFVVQGGQGRGRGVVWIGEMKRFGAKFDVCIEGQGIEGSVEMCDEETEIKT